MKPKTIYPRLLQLSAAFLLLPLGMNAQTYPIDHIDRPDEVHFVSDTTGSVIYNSANASSGVNPANPLVLQDAAPGSQFKWSFSFQIPEDRLDRVVAIRLDNGGAAAAGRLLAGIALNSSGQLGYMTNPNEGSLSNQMTYLTDPLSVELWYDVTFLFTSTMVGEDMEIAYDLTISDILEDGISVSYVPSGLAPNEVALRQILSFFSTNGGTDIKVRDVSLQTIAIPEPATLPVLLVVAGILVGLHLRKRNRS